MRLPFLKKGKAKIEGEEILLALDVGTKFVKAVLFKVIDNKVNVIGYAEQFHAFCHDYQPSKCHSNH